MRRERLFFLFLCEGDEETREFFFSFSNVKKIEKVIFFFSFVFTTKKKLLFFFSFVFVFFSFEINKTTTMEIK